MNTIVVGYDGSEQSDRALARAVDIGKAMGAGLRVVSAVKVGQAAHARSGGVGTVDPGDAEELAANLEKARGLTADAGIAVQMVEGHGDPADVVVQEAKDHDAGLIVVGTHGKHFAQRVLQGSVSTKIVQHAECDVLVVR
jgi:nucleotide-binding universal stress UspA family protein